MVTTKQIPFLVTFEAAEEDVEHLERIMSRETTRMIFRPAEIKPMTRDEPTFAHFVRLYESSGGPRAAISSLAKLAYFELRSEERSQLEARRRENSFGSYSPMSNYEWADYCGIAAPLERGTLQEFLEKYGTGQLRKLGLSKRQIDPMKKYLASLHLRIGMSAAEYYQAIADHPVPPLT